MNLEIDIDRKKFLNFYKKQYLNNPLKRDSLSDLLKGLLYNKSELCKSVDLEPVMIVDNEKIVMICLLAYAHRMPDYIQMGFFESEELNMEAFKLILNRAKILAREKKAHKISASLNIHVNYGLGFLASDYDSMQSFGMAHNPEFYHSYFELNGFKSIDMVSYKKNMQDVDQLINIKIKNKLDRLYKVREANFKDLEKDINIYTNVNNKAFKDHLFYYPRKVQEDLELFKDLRFLLKPENLLFVEKNGEAVGFMLWYPDFNQIMKPNETVGLRTVVKNKLFSNKITTFKIVEMGVIPKEQSRGAILALFNYCFRCIKGKYNNVESGWILSHNNKSKDFGVKWADGESKHYKAYIKDLNDENYNSLNDLLVDNNYNVIKLNKEFITLLNLLEHLNPCRQKYEITEDAIVISYFLKLNIFNFRNTFPLSVNAQIIGLPISVSEKGYWGDIDSVIKIINQRKGLKILLNGDNEFQNGGRTLSTFVFENNFFSFNEYLNSLRSSYRRRINKALKKREKLEIVKIDRNNFDKKHYELYLSIMERTENPLETLKIDFFRKYDAEIYEFNDVSSGNTVAFIQLKIIKNKLYFLFGGFHKEHNYNYDIYFNMLLEIIKIGIERNVDIIEFGQTAEESKLKIGCKEIPKYLYVHHSNPILNYIIQKMLPMFSYKPYHIKHHVFKQNHGDWS